MVSMAEVVCSIARGVSVHRGRGFPPLSPPSSLPLSPPVSRFLVFILEIRKNTTGTQQVCNNQHSSTDIPFFVNVGHVWIHVGTDFCSAGVPLALFY